MLFYKDILVGDLTQQAVFFTDESQCWFSIKFVPDAGITMISSRE